MFKKTKILINKSFFSKKLVFPNAPKSSLANNGFTLLLSLVVMSAVLVTSLGIADIVAREINLSSIGKESQVAFYAADTGAECAMYWDIQAGPLSTKTETQISCAGVSGLKVGGATTNFKFDLPNGSCVSVDVNLSVSPKIIQAHGFNITCASTELRKVERILEVKY